MKKIDNKNELMKINGGKKDKTKCYLTEGGETVAGGLAGLGTACLLYTSDAADE